jgi:1-acyl-sn-glycerol-3-phosphate acyltransferase
MKGLILNIYDYFKTHKVAYWVTLILSFSVLVALSFRITFEEDISKMLQMDEKTREYNNIIQNTKLVDKLIVSISFDDTSKRNDQLLCAFGDSLESKLQQKNKGLLKRIVLKSDDISFNEVYDVILRNLPLFIEPCDYPYIDSILSPAAINNHIESNRKLLGTPAGIMVSQTMKYDPTGVSLPVILRLQKLGNATGYEMSDGYFFTKNHQKLILFLEPVNPASETGKNTKLINIIDEQVSYIKNIPEFKDMQCRYIGPTAIAVGNAKQIQRDTMLTVTVLILALVLLIGIIFRKKRTPILIFSPVIFGLAFALALIAFIKPTISLIAIGASSVLLGIAVNFPLHILTHYLHEKNLRTIVGDMVVPMTIGSATTIGGFLCLLFVKADILHDFGLLGALSLVGAVLFSLIFLPHLIGPSKESSASSVEKVLEKVGKYNLETKRFPVLLIFILTPILLFMCRNIQFDSDLSNLNFMSNDLKQAEADFTKYDSLSYPFYIISYGKNIDETLLAAAKIEHLSDSLNNIGIKNSYAGIASILPSKAIQKERLEKWKQYWTEEKKHEVLTAIAGASKREGFKSNAFNNFNQLIDTPPAYIDSADYNLLIQTFAKDALTVNADITTLVSILKVKTSNTLEVAPCLSNMPNTTLLDKKFLANKLYSVINDDFNFIAIFTAILVFVALLLTYGRIELALTAFIPMVVSWIWILGLMGIFNLKFNIVNIILSTFIFGLGDDYCIFIMDGLLQEYKTGKKQMAIIKMSIIISGATTLIGFGVLLLAKHPALQSLAAVSIIGILSVLFVSQTLEPFLFRLFVSKPVARGQAPISFFTVIKSVFTFTFFITGSIFLNIVGLFIVALNPFKRQGRRIFNFLISKVAWSQLYIMGNVKKNVVIVEKPDYNKPFLIISNHQSVVDILYIALLNPKIILLTNKWVWNSPLFGYVVRMAGYCTIVEGAEINMNKLKERIAEGYSIAVFPEGTRTKDGAIQRFHKGAFYMAQELNLDIVPVIIHGTGKCIEKDSFVLRDHPISVKILPRILQSDTNYGVTYQERTKSIAAYFKKEYAIFSGEIETAEYYKSKIIDNFLFKGPVLEWYMKVKIRMEDNYKQFHSLTPEQGRIIDAGCGYGFMSYMLAFLSPARDIVGIDYDNEKVEVAQNGFARPKNLTFVAANLNEFNYTGADCVIFSDVLHYIDKKTREEIFVNCAKQLNSGGIIIIRDGDKNLKKEHKSTKLTEFLSTKVFKFNKAENNLEFFTAQSLIDLGNTLGLKSETVGHRKWLSNVIIKFSKA